MIIREEKNLKKMSDQNFKATLTIPSEIISLDATWPRIITFTQKTSLKKEKIRNQLLPQHHFDKTSSSRAEYTSPAPNGPSSP